jgi:hypothetical protein
MSREETKVATFQHAPEVEVKPGADLASRQNRAKDGWQPVRERDGSGERVRPKPTENKNESESIPCGLYRTTQPLGTKLPAGALVYYHNHGKPGPGIYPVERWSHNKAVFVTNGILVHDHRYPETLEALAPEGFYRVTREFTCCSQACTTFAPETLVQLGYNGRGEAILFSPSWSTAGVHLPERGTRVEDDRLVHLTPLRIPFRDPPTGADTQTPGPQLDSSESGPGPDTLLH